MSETSHEALHLSEAPHGAVGLLEAPPAQRTRCPICFTETAVVDTVHGEYSGRDFTLRRCPDCRFAFVADPWTDYARIYDAAYYAGEGADPLVDYHFELAEPAKTIRVYEWRGIAKAAAALGGATAGTRWLDFGAGNGGLVRHLRDEHAIDAIGFEDGAIAAEAAGLGVPFVTADELDGQLGSYDVVSAIEVLEHVVDPVAELRRMRSLLRPGGLLLLTTGNAAPHADKLARWRYVTPEIHISFFEPRTLERAMAMAGLRAQPLGSTPGVADILKFKVLKNLKLRRRSALVDLVPAGPTALLADRLARVRDMPIGWAVDDAPA
jgi:2-polyprenyl-3-methyl-5-hydroxy-6-metoxy-1,4-benzoquinol methylase